ncbi:hypothetical protein D3870_13680 [Noviherbaspirillum cavernae]|uniref:Nucleotidyltransferase family protein n=1 Tax=Noviherbaspirillum cavernae TaxID=2320862 RepID=A0A418X387_9BURK|nr:nucleotidyltransferase [Noviherbaspirillum cavernae]RJG06909.1 hypothetical protein D3870_13680 [Noviherbaspirillum cavernae]
MQATTPALPAGLSSGTDTEVFYRQVLDIMNACGIPFLVGGGYAFNCYTGFNRQTKDMDVFIRRPDYERIAEMLSHAGYDAELTYPHWLAKIRFDDAFIDLIFSSGNGVASVDDAWFEHAEEAEVAGVRVKLCPVEEIIWSKAFVMERERFDGADIVHLIRARGPQLDWARLLHRFGPHWRVLLSHLILFGFVYPDQRNLVPAHVMTDLLERLRLETGAPPPTHGICQGTLLSREQYLNDIEQQGLQDGRVVPFGYMTQKETGLWKEGIPDERKES